MILRSIATGISAIIFPVRVRSTKIARNLVFAIAATIAVTGSVSVSQAADRISVVVDQAKVLQLPPKTATIIVGNPMIADVTMINRNQQMILTGKSFGQTNMIALDAKGNSVGESTVIVKGQSTGLVVQRGMERETYSCQPRCQPTVTIGDNSKFVAQSLQSVKLRSDAAKPGK